MGMHITQHSQHVRCQCKAAPMHMSHESSSSNHVNQYLGLGAVLPHSKQATSTHVVQELHASIAAELDPSSYMIRHFRAMCCEQRQDFHCARIDYQAMLNMSKRMPQKVAALKVIPIWHSAFHFRNFPTTYTSINLNYEMCILYIFLG